MLTFLLAAAAAGSVPAGQVPFSKDPDIRCMAAYLVAAGEAQDDPAISADDKAGIQAIAMYFLGKLYAQRPEADLRGEILTLVETPGYVALLGADIDRCSVEAEERGKYLSSFGDAPAPAPAASAAGSAAARP